MASNLDLGRVEDILKIYPFKELKALFGSYKMNFGEFYVESDFRVNKYLSVIDSLVKYISLATGKSSDEVKDVINHNVPNLQILSNETNSSFGDPEILVAAWKKLRNAIDNFELKLPVVANVKKVDIGCIDSFMNNNDISDDLGPLINFIIKYSAINTLAYWCDENYPKMVNIDESNNVQFEESEFGDDPRERISSWNKEFQSESKKVIPENTIRTFNFNAKELQDQFNKNLDGAIARVVNINPNIEYNDFRDVVYKRVSSEEDRKKYLEAEIFRNNTLKMQLKMLKKQQRSDLEIISRQHERIEDETEEVNGKIAALEELRDKYERCLVSNDLMEQFLTFCGLMNKPKESFFEYLKYNGEFRNKTGETLSDFRSPKKYKEYIEMLIKYTSLATEKNEVDIEKMLSLETPYGLLSGLDEKILNDRLYGMSALKCRYDGDSNVKIQLPYPVEMECGDVVGYINYLNAKGDNDIKKLYIYILKNAASSALNYVRNSAIFSYSFCDVDNLKKEADRHFFTYCMNALNGIEDTVKCNLIVYKLYSFVNDFIEDEEIKVMFKELLLSIIASSSKNSIGEKKIHI